MDFFTYRAKMIRVVDADTIDVMLDLGFNVFHKVRCRLAGINAPEIKTEEGKIAKQFLIDTVPVDADIIIESKKYDKYGRSLAILHYQDMNINKLLIDNKLAVPYMV